MSKAKSTRSSRLASEGNDAGLSKKAPTIPSSYKVFYLPKDLAVTDDGNHVKQFDLEWLFHPGKGRKALFASHDKKLLEVIEFAEPRRSWFFDNNLCANGRIYMTVPVDATFLAIYHLRKHCSQRAVPLDNIHDDKDSSAMRLLNHFVEDVSLRCIADEKKAGGQCFYKFSRAKTIAWLALKARRLAATLREADVYCGRSAVSQNYAKSEKSSAELVQDIDFLRMAADIVGDYIEMDLYDELRSYLEIPPESLTKTEATDGATKKRKSKNSASKDDEDANSKKIKLQEQNATLSLKNNSLIDESLEEEKSSLASPSISSEKQVSKERALTTKEKALAKSAKGSKSITSFFKKA